MKPWIFAALLVPLFAGCADSHGSVNATDLGPSGLDGGSSIDANLLFDQGADSGAAPACGRPMDVQADPCVDVDCAPDAPTQYFWNGDECAPWPDCTSCTGSDCDAFMTLDQCHARYDLCTSVRCEASGGFFRAEHAYCGNFVCGHAADMNCEVGAAACDCGLGKIFEEGVGCVASADCGRADLCVATHGRWGAYSLNQCGGEAPGAPPQITCNCGAPFVFDESLGCTAPLIDLCISPSDEQYCARTGGAWVDGCPQACGETFDCACAGCMGCRCGRLEVFDSARGGCVRDASCSVGVRSGGNCGSGTIDDARCETGLACCSGGASSDGHCEASQCSSFGACGPPRP
ncbi:MAG: hypothetical protein IPK60_02150 [Sandaracinaceae bacterium]|nr:hypothetical protein [Sandaracinaceae bacterium]